MLKLFRLQLTLISLLACLAGFACTPAQMEEEAAYPEPRFPGYVQPPSSVDEVMPYAQAAVRQTGGRTPLGLIESGKRVALFAGARSLVPPNPLVLKAIVQAYQERDISARIIVPEPPGNEINLGPGWSSEFGFMEARFWVNRWPDSDEPKQWLQDKNPGLYEKMFNTTPGQAYTATLDPDLLAELEEDPNIVFWSGTPREYMDLHGEEFDALFAGYGGRPGVIRRMGPHGDKVFGNFIFDHHLEVMNKVTTYPGDLWRLVEERIIEPLQWIDRGEVQDPEGTDFSFDLSPELARMWAEGAYLQGHLFMFPHQATGRRPFSIEEYPRMVDLWQPPVVPEVNGVVAGTKNHTGFYPRIEVVIEGGRLKEVRGGGDYGDFFRAFLNHPKLEQVQYPYYKKQGYWFLYEAGLGTNPKFFQRPDELRHGSNGSERNVAGVIHWAFGAEVDGDPAGQEGTWARFAEEENVPNGHWLHIHNVLPTYRVRVRNTENWLTLIDRGRLQALEDPEVRALAARYGDPDEVLRQEWVPDIPGVTSPGSLDEFARNPWAHAEKLIEQLQEGTYPYLAQ